jgi:uncharacterized OB-fold protein
MEPIRPRSSLDTAPYWDGCRRGELLFQRCQGCCEAVFHPRALCPYCLSDDLDWTASAGKGAIYSFTVQYVPLRPAGEPYRPRLLGIAALDEGFHMFAEFVAEAPATPAVGARLEVFFDPVADDLVLPKFKVLP